MQQRHPPPQGGDAFVFSGGLPGWLCLTCIEFRLDETGNLLEVALSVYEIQVVAFDDQQWTAPVVRDPSFVMPVELLEVFALDTLFKRAPSTGRSVG